MPFTPLVFIAFVPLLMVQDDLELNNKKGFFKYAFTTLLVWNVSVTFWVVNSTLVGGIAAFILNSLLLYLPLLTFSYIKRKTNFLYGMTAFISAWLLFEKIHLTWEFSWPWLTLGNVFANRPDWIQWYEYTGHLGGSLWVLLVNALVFYFIKTYSNIDAKRNTLWLLLPAILVFVLPLIGSKILKKTSKNIPNLGTPSEVVVVQPNIDPYNEKFDYATVPFQMSNLINLSNKVITENTDFILWPETAIPTPTWLENIEEPPYMKTIKQFVDSCEHATLVTGITLLDYYDDAATSTARPGGDGFYDVYNAAMSSRKNASLEFYKKSKLVPGVERMPYPQFFKFLGPLSINLGGMVGSHGTQDQRGVFTNESNHKIAPVICYESVYGEFVTDYMKAGAEAFFILTNDAWWGNTPGYLQHCQYAVLRSIETRKWCARSANTGISCFIDPLGEVLQATSYWEPAVIKQKIFLNKIETIYIRYGDKWLLIFAFLLLISYIRTFKMFNKI
jgi:apolipoprotein N-acyltransferase